MGADACIDLDTRLSLWHDIVPKNKHVGIMKDNRMDRQTSDMYSKIKCVEVVEGWVRVVVLVEVRSAYKRGWWENCKI